MKYNAPYGSLDPDASYVDRDTPGGIAGSKVPRQAVEDPQREIVALITKSGFTPSAADLTQLLKAVRSQKLNYITDSGTANAMVVTLDPALPAYTTGLILRVIKSAAASSIAGVTINVNGLGAKTIKRRDGSALVAGDLPANSLLALIYDGTDFRLISMAISDVVTLIGAKGGFAGNFEIRNIAGTANWTVPAGVTRARAQVWGGGGGGGGAQANGFGGGGGGGGGYSESVINGLTPGANVSVTVGAGGAGATGFNVGTNGGSSSFGAYHSAGGGIGGAAGSTGAPGQVRDNTTGVGTGGTINLTGQRGSGGQGPANSYGAIGGDGGSAPFGGGGGGPGSTGDSNVGTSPGGGGGGAGGFTGVGSTGGTGAAGMVVISWVDPT